MQLTQVLATMLQFVLQFSYDVCRDTANRGKSFAGMVASMDEGCTKFFNATMEHAEEQELSNTFAAFLVLACTEFRAQRGYVPGKNSPFVFLELLYLTHKLPH